MGSSESHIGTSGPGSAIEEILAEYGLGANSWAADVLQSDTDRLLVALLLEERGANGVTEAAATGDDSPVSYNTQGRDPIEVTSTEWQRIEWGEEANTVLIYEYDAPLLVRFVDSERDDNMVRLPKGSAPFTISGTSGFPATKLWYRKMNSDDKDTQFSVLTF